MLRAPRRGTAVIAVAVGLAAAALGIGLVLGGAVVDDAPDAADRARPDGSRAAPVPTRSGRFSLDLPAAWRKLPAADPEIRLLAAGPRGASLLLRAQASIPLPRKRRLAAFGAYSRQLLTERAGVRLVGDVRRVRLAGLDGFSYLYTFPDRRSGRRGVHSHIMLLDGDRALSLVFQAVPAERFASLAPTFDRIAASLRVQQ